jgi:hypothetical protein
MFPCSLLASRFYFTTFPLLCLLYMKGIIVILIFLIHINLIKLKDGDLNLCQRFSPDFVPWVL